MEGKASLRLSSCRDEYEVYHCDYAFDKKINRAGDVRSDVLGGNIRIFLPIIPTGELLAWAFDAGKKLNGVITVNDAHEETLEKVSFENARCTGFRIHYEPGKHLHNVILALTVNTPRMIIGNVEYKNPFRRK